MYAPSGIPAASAADTMLSRSSGVTRTTGSVAVRVADSGVGFSISARTSSVVRVSPKRALRSRAI